MPRMTAVDGKLFADDAGFKVTVTTNAAGARLLVAEVPFDEAVEENTFFEVETFGANVTKTVLVPTPTTGVLYVLRLFGGNSGTGGGQGDLIDELNVPCLNGDQRKNYLTMCSEGKPQVAVAAGGTYVTADIGSGSAITRALLVVTDADLTWPGGGKFPTLDGATETNFVLVLSDRDPRSNSRTHRGRQANRHMDGQCIAWDLAATLRFVALVWDSDGAFDFTWNSERNTANARTPVETIVTKPRTVELTVTKLVCMYDSDQLSNGDGTFKITMTPAAPGTAVSRSVRWRPMESGSSRSLNERFRFTGRETDRITVDVHGVDDDSGSFPPDDD